MLCRLHLFVTIRQQTTHLWLKILQTLSYYHWLENLPTLEAIDLSWKWLHQDCKLTTIILFPYQFQEKASIPRFQLHWILVGSFNNHNKDNYYHLLSHAMIMFLSISFYVYRLLVTNYTYCYGLCNYNFWWDWFGILQLFVSTSSNSVPLVYTVLLASKMNELHNIIIARYF